MEKISIQKTIVFILYNGVRFYKHPKHPYYFSSGKHTKYNRSLHRQIWFDHYGEIEAGYDIHHLDENPENNDISNLAKILSTEHQRYHSNKRKKSNPEFFVTLQKEGIKHAPKWHASEEGRKWHGENAANMNLAKRTYGDGECQQCKKTFIRPRGHSKFCSNNCKSAWRRKNNPDLIIRNCDKCGKQYETLKYLPRKFCSRKCRPAPNPKGTFKKKIA